MRIEEIIERMREIYNEKMAEIKELRKYKKENLNKFYGEEDYDYEEFEKYCKVVHRYIVKREQIYLIEDIINIIEDKGKESLSKNEIKEILQERRQERITTYKNKREKIKEYVNKSIMEKDEIILINKKIIGVIKIINDITKKIEE